MNNLHVAWAKLLFEGFVAAGVQHVVLSPGSRSTPLALAAAAEPGLQVHVVLDERQGGFFALGQARLTGRPSVVVCTSGTAAAHYLPALLEAREAGVPIVVLTADRPWEAHHVHSAQTTDQLKLFGDAVRGFFGLGTPESQPLALAAVARTAQQAVALARGPVPGGVHVNAPFRKPLEPALGHPVPSVQAVRTVVLGTEAHLDDDARRALAERVRACRRPVFVAGPAIGSMQNARAAMQLALDVTGGVLVAEATSGLRAHSLLHADQLVPLLEGAAAPDLIVTVGLPPVSTALQNWLSRSTAPRLVMAPAGWPDPWSSASMLLPLGAAHGLGELARAWQTRGDPTWRASLHAADQALETELGRAFENGVLAPHSALNEPAIARALVSTLPVSATLVVGNSLPVRDLDVFGGRGDFATVHQRGVAGIDGLLSGAAGAASVARGPVVLYAGDVSFLHDAGALAVLARATTPVVVLVVNNDGGRIFQELPVARDARLSEALRDLFIVPHGHSLCNVAAGFGVAALRVDQLVSLERALREALTAKHCTVIEAVVAPDAGTDLRRAWREHARTIVS